MIWACNGLFCIIILTFVQCANCEVHNTYKCLKEHDYLNPLAINSNEDVDIFLDSDLKSKEKAKLASRNLFESALQSIKNYKSKNSGYTEAQRSKEMATLDPKLSKCAFLSIEHIERAGLGHTVVCFGKYLHDAISNSLTYHTPFYSGAHEICDLNATTNFFGFHSAFYWANSPSKDAKIVHVGSAITKNGCSSETLSKAVQTYKKENGEFSCDKGDVVFRCHNEKEDFQRRFMKSIIGWEVPTRAVFRSSYDTYKGYYQHDPMMQAKRNGDLVVVCHMRRGDILQSRRIDKEHRLVNFAAYTSMLRAVVEVKMKSNKFKDRKMSVFFLCEGAPDKNHVIDFNEMNPRQTFSVDLQSTLDQKSNCNQQTNCFGEAIVDSTFLSSFTAMCEADVLVSSLSSYPWSAAALCEPPVTLAIPFSQSYDGIEGVALVKPSMQYWKKDVTVTVPHLEQVFARRLG